mmetsp:Transcript_6868/g.14305  ORF Transcript_6868/g.14305 Transcript_6868/m.14305 type:complete len:123 (-) Transcript_6868:545-913(-)
MAIKLHRFGCVLLLALLQLDAVSGFQVITTRRRPKNLSSNAPLLGAADRKNSITLTATLEEEEMVADFKMITEDESKLRKIGGIVIGIATVAAYFAQGPNYANLSTGVFAAISTYRTGAEYQ